MKGANDMTTKQATHITAGDWHILGSIAVPSSTSPTGQRRIIATEEGADKLDILAANAPICDNVRTLPDARLIKAAPALFRAAVEILEEWEADQSGTTYAGFEALRAAIAAAKGK